MSHHELKLAAYEYFKDDLNVLYVDTTLDELDQTVQNLHEHIMYNSEDWELMCYTSPCGIRPPQSIEDMIDYIKTNLRKVE